MDALTLAELTAMVEGFRAFHGGAERAEEPDEGEFYRALAEARAAGQA